MRQAGIVAAGGLYAVRHHIGRLAEDHANARYLAAALNEFKLFSVDLARVQTNIVLADINGAETSDSVLARMNEVGVWAIAFGLKRIRLVTHLDVPRADCEEAVARLRTILV